MRFYALVVKLVLDQNHDLKREDENESSLHKVIILYSESKFLQQLVTANDIVIYEKGEAS